VLARGEHFSDTESDSDDETRPLLRPGGYGTQGGTFNNERENPLATQDGESSANETVVLLESADENDDDAPSIEAVIIESQPRDSNISALDEDEEGNHSLFTICDIRDHSTPQPEHEDNDADADTVRDMEGTRTPPNSETPADVFFTPQSIKTDENVVDI